MVTFENIRDWAVDEFCKLLPGSRVFVRNDPKSGLDGEVILGCSLGAAYQVFPLSYVLGIYEQRVRGACVSLNLAVRIALAQPAPQSLWKLSPSDLCDCLTDHYNPACAKCNGAGILDEALRAPLSQGTCDCAVFLFFSSSFDPACLKCHGRGVYGTVFKT